MSRRISRFRQNGFTLVEALVVVAFVGIVTVIGSATLPQMLQKVRLEKAARDASSLMRLTRFEAIKQGVQTVVMMDPNTRELIAFADVHGGLDQTLPSDGIFNAIGGATYRTTDYEISRLKMPAGVYFVDETGQTDLDSVDGFEYEGGGPPNDQAIFLTDGSVMEVGAFRFGDSRGNYLEARVDPPATARIEIRKWDEDGVPDPDWYAFGEGGKPWVWK